MIKNFKQSINLYKRGSIVTAVVEKSRFLNFSARVSVKNPFKHHTPASVSAKALLSDRFFLLPSLNFCILPHNRCIFLTNFVHILTNTFQNSQYDSGWGNGLKDK